MSRRAMVLGLVLGLLVPAGATAHAGVRWRVEATPVAGVEGSAVILGANARDEVLVMSLVPDGESFRRASYVVRGARATELPAPDAFGARAVDLNDRGVVLGEAGDPAAPTLVTWVRGRPRPVPLPPGVHASPIDLNNRGDILFASVDVPGEGLHVRYADGRIVPVLSPYPGFPYPQTGTYAWQDYLGDDGSVVFFVRPGLDLPTRSWLWTAGRTTEIGPVEAEHLGRGGHVIGIAAGPAGGPGFVWRAGRLRPLGGVASAVNARGVVAGASPAGADQRATVWRDGVPRVLPGPPGQLSSLARSVNDRGRIAGEVTDAGGVTRAVAWDHGRRFDLDRASGGTGSLAWVVAPGGAVYGFAGGQAGPAGLYRWRLLHR
jgi:hypothetical protein